MFFVCFMLFTNTTPPIQFYLDVGGFGAIKSHAFFCCVILCDLILKKLWLYNIVIQKYLIFYFFFRYMKVSFILFSSFCKTQKAKGKFAPVSWTPLLHRRPHSRVQNVTAFSRMRSSVTKKKKQETYKKIKINLKPPCIFIFSFYPNFL